MVGGRAVIVACRSCFFVLFVSVVLGVVVLCVFVVFVILLLLFVGLFLRLFLFIKWPCFDVGASSGEE